MRFFAFGPILLPALLITTMCHAQTKPVAPTGTAGDLYKNEAMVWEHFDTTIRMHADGTGERTVHIVARLQSEGAARQFSVLSIPYASAYENGTMDFIRVHKPDGSTIETPAADAIEMPAAVTREAPLYSDLKEKQLPVRSVAAGDVIDYQFHTERTRAEAPGQFWGSEHFLSTAGVVLSQTLMLEIPAGKYVQVWDPNHPAKSTEQNGFIRYSWSNAQLKPTAKANAQTDTQKDPLAAEIKDMDQDADGRLLPSVAWTTFHNWAEVGEWYRGLSHDRITPTPTIQARANKLTVDAKTPEAQVQALYDFVAMKTRYVGIDFGVGRYQPHTADEVMDHEYGDCKDKDTLLESLLRAKGFNTAPALIGVNVALVPDLPSPASFNHVITTVELPNGAGKATGQIWLDTTPEVAPFRVLIPLIRDEQALVVPASGSAALERTPADPPFPYFERFTATGSLDKDGLLKSHMEMTLRSDNELGFRVLLQRAAPAQWDEAMQSISSALGFGGKVSNADLKQADQTGPVRISYDYARPEFGDWASHRIVPLFPMLEIAVIDKDKAPEHDIDQGAPRTLDAVTRIRLPEGFSADLPDAVHVKRDYATFDKTYRLDKGELEVERKVVILKKKIPKADWKNYSAYSKSIGVEDGETFIVLLQSTPKGEKKASAADPENKSSVAAGDTKSNGADLKSEVASTDTDAQQLMTEALSAMRAGDRAKETALLQKIQAAHPDYPYLMSMLGSIALSKGNTDEGIQDLKVELKNHPNADVSIPLMLAAAYVKQKQNDTAIALLKSYGDRNDTRISTTLSVIQRQKGDDQGALETVQADIVAHPDDRFAKVRLSNCFHRLHREQEAAEAAEKAMDGSDDPNLLNDAAYELSETKVDLPLAEKNSRHSLALAETASASVTLQETNSNAFRRSEMLIASWDTLGWILFEEGKPAEAEPYLRAAWFHRPDLVVGHHLAQVLEAGGKPSDALTIDNLALASEGNDEEAKAQVMASVERLKKDKAHSSEGNAVQTLQNMRTFYLDRPKQVKGSGVIRMQFGDGGIKDWTQVSGDESVRPVEARLNTLKMPNAVPPGSHALLIRDGVFTCSELFATCELVLIPHSGLAVEGAH
jgi:predicted Zn-dependent protease